MQPTLPKRRNPASVVARTDTLPERPFHFHEHWGSADRSRGANLLEGAVARIERNLSHGRLSNQFTSPSRPKFFAPLFPGLRYDPVVVFQQTRTAKATTVISS